MSIKNTFEIILKYLETIEGVDRILNFPNSNYLKNVYSECNQKINFSHYANKKEKIDSYEKQIRRFCVYLNFKLGYLNFSFQYLPVVVYVSVRPSVCPYVRPSVCPYVLMSVCPYVRMSLTKIFEILYFLPKL